MQKKTCIICRQTKAKFNKEHVFPETIGGRFIIKSVCTECNKILGDNIDTPFNNDPLILIYRQALGLSRNNRSIKNPIPPQITPDGRRYITELTDGGYKAKFPPQFLFDKMNAKGVVTAFMSSEYIECPMATVNHHMEKMYKESGVHPSAVHIEKVQEQPLTPKIVSKDVNLIWEFIKIGYESAVTFVPQYFNDPLAGMYSNMLFTRKMHVENEVFYNPQGIAHQEIVLEGIKNLQGLELASSFVILFEHSQYGFCCIVKIFQDRVFSFILSKAPKYLNNCKLVLINDSKSKLFFCSLLKTPSAYLFEFYPDLMSEKHRKEIFNENFDQNTFCNSAGTISLYDEYDSIIVPSVDMFIYRPQKIKPENFSQLVKTNEMDWNFNKGHFLKSNKTGLRYQLSKLKIQLNPQ